MNTIRQFMRLNGLSRRALSELAGVSCYRVKYPNRSAYYRTPTVDSWLANPDSKRYRAIPDAVLDRIRAQALSNGLEWPNEDKV